MRLVTSVVVVAAGLLIAAAPLAATATEMDNPNPVATGQPTVGVTIPGPSGTPSPSPSSAAGGSSGGGSSSPNPSPSPTTPSCVQIDDDGAPAAPEVPAVPAEDEGTITIDPKEASPGRTITVRAQGFTGGEVVEAMIYPEAVSIGSFDTQPDGSLEARVRLPADTSVGEHTIQLLGWSSCAAAVGDVFIVSLAGNGESIFPWIAWVIVGGGVTLAAVLALVAWLLGWLPFARRVGGIA